MGSSAACETSLRFLPQPGNATLRVQRRGTSIWYLYIHTTWFWGEVWHDTSMLNIFVGTANSGGIRLTDMHQLHKAEMQHSLQEM